MAPAGHMYLYIFRQEDTPYARFQLTYIPSQGSGTINAIEPFIAGLYHETIHLEQLKEIMRQGRELHSRS